MVTVEGPDGTEHIHVPSQVSAFAVAARERTREKQTEIL